MTEQKPKAQPKTRTTKPKVQPVLEPSIKNEVVEEVKVAETPAKPSRKSIATIDLNDLVPVVSLVDSVIFVADSTKAEYEWDSKGDVLYITYGELISMKGRQKRFLDEMWVYIDDEEVVRALNLTSLYEKYDEIKSLEEYLNIHATNYELKEVLQKLPSSIKKSLGRQAAQLIEEGSLDGHQKIKALEESLGVDLTHLLK